MPRRVTFGWMISLLITLFGFNASAEEVAAVPNLARDATAPAAKVSVDSTFSGYGTAVLADGKWIAEDKETTQDTGHADRLGNGGNTWVSADTDTDHWVRLDWPQPVKINEVRIWWSRSEWHPKAFRIEQLCEEKWIPIAESATWMAATDRQSIVPLREFEARSIRIVQPAGGAGQRSLMAVQEVLVFHRPEKSGPPTGTRELPAAEVRKLTARTLVPNIAQLETPGASSPIAWVSGGKRAPAGPLADGDFETVVRLDQQIEAFGIEWPVAHVVERVAVVFRGDVPAPSALVVEAHDGERWVTIKPGLRAERKADEHRLTYSFEPVATGGIRLRAADGPFVHPATELEVFRYLPPAKNVWPERLVNPGGLKDEILAGDREPCFESLAMCALSITPARALMGLKDTPHEVGVNWDGTLVGRDTLRFSFGEEQYGLSDCRDTVVRRLIDGWRPGVIVRGQLGKMSVCQTAFVGLIDGDSARPALFVRVELRNLTDKPLKTSIEAEISGKGPATQFRDGALFQDERLVLLGSPACRAGTEGRALKVDVELDPAGRAHADFVQPRYAATADSPVEPNGSASFDKALGWFRQYWDETLSSAVKLDLPEARINRMYRAVLAQVFINGDGNIMRYGSEPSVYSENLYGVEESYAMLALAMWGFPADAQRYLDGTYLTRDFLKKVEVYKTYANRHQQYRNGLIPHYAISAYRFSRDADWIGKHLPLIRDCAEWTIAQRRKTMVLEDGQKPLHWGLLPKWSYGGDVSEVQCYAIYANYCCWRGLVDTAWLLNQLGDTETARRYAEEAREYRAAIDRAVDGSYISDRQPPFLPLRLYADRPDEQMDYYQLFAGLILGLSPYEKGDKHFRWIADFLETDNRMFCLLPRFRRDVGAGGLDALYAKGYLLAKLREDSVKEFLLGFYAFLAFNMDHETFASRETNLLYASDLHLRSSYRVPDISDPIPCSAAVALQLLRQMLVAEEVGKPGEFTGELHLLSAVPRAWLGDGQTIGVTDAPTQFGPVSLEVRSAVDLGRIEARIVATGLEKCRSIKLRIRHPEARPPKSVSVNGKPWSDIDPAGEWVVLPGEGSEYNVVLNY